MKDSARNARWLIRYDPDAGVAEERLVKYGISKRTLAKMRSECEVVKIGAHKFYVPRGRVPPVERAIRKYNNEFARRFEQPKPSR